MRINVGCGQTPTPGWVNIDNSPSVKLATRPIRRWVMSAAGLLHSHHKQFIRFCQENDIRHGSGLRLPMADGTVEVVYSSHTLEHLDRVDARAFLAEALRVLRPGGVLRIAVPDLHYYAKQYLADGDLEHFMTYTHLVGPPTRTLWQKLHAVVIGKRHHQWMYDARTLTKLFDEVGFVDVRALPAGETTITDPGTLDLAERAPVSLYVEGRRP